MPSELESTTDILRHSNPNENEYSIYMPIYVVTSFFGVIFIVGPLLVRRGPNKDIIRVCIMLTAFHMWLLWVTIYISQMHPVLEPGFKNTTLAWMMYKYGTGDPPPTTTTVKPTTQSTPSTHLPTAKPTSPPTAKSTSPPTAKPISSPTAKPTSPPTAKSTSPPMAKPTSSPTTKSTSPPTTKPTPPPSTEYTATSIYRHLYKTDVNSNYKYVPVKKLIGSGKTADIVSAESKNMGIALSMDENQEIPTYEIRIGEYGMILKKYGKEVAKNENYVVPTKEPFSEYNHFIPFFLSYWLEWEGGKVVVGTNFVQHKPFALTREDSVISWQDPDPSPINYIGFCCTPYAGEWGYFERE